MQFLTREQFSEAVESVLNHAPCNHAWLGHGNPYFLGFGHEKLPPHVYGLGLRNQKQPEYRLTCHLSSWEITRNCISIGEQEDPDEKAETAIQTLIGRTVQDYLIRPDWGLVVEFDDSLTLVTTPYRSPYTR